MSGFIVEGRQTPSEQWTRMWLGMTEPVPFSNRDDAEDFAWNQRREYEDAGEALETRIVEVSNMEEWYRNAALVACDKLRESQKRVDELTAEVAKERARAIRRGEQADIAVAKLAQFRADDTAEKSSP